jgi:hypothetical protein
MDGGSLSDTQRTMVLPLLQETNIRGRPYVTVSSKGIANGLSRYPNDGADFGPDTTLGATAPGQYGGTYTETTGIQEAWNYAATQGNQTIMFTATYNDKAPFQINTDILVPNIAGGKSIRLVGQGRTGGTVLQFNSGCTKGIDYGANYSGNFVGNAQIENIALWANTSTLTSLLNIPCTTPGGYVSLRDVQYGGPVIPAYTDAAIYISGVQFVSLIGVSDEQGKNNGVTIINAGICWITDYRGAGATVTLQGNNYAFLSIKNGTPIILQGNGYTHITGNYINGNTITCNDTNSIIILSGNFVLANVTPVIISSGALVNILSLRDAVIDAGVSDLPFVTNNGTLKYFDKKNIIFGNTDAESIVFPTNSPTLSANPPVSGTAYQNTNPYDIRLKIPVTYNPTATAAATLATGISSTSTVTTTTKVSIPAGLTSADGQILTYEMVVPAGWYFEIVATNATIGTAEVQAA